VPQLALRSYYRKAQQVRALIARDFANVRERSSHSITPTTPTRRFRSAQKPIRRMYLTTSSRAPRILPACRDVVPIGPWKAPVGGNSSRVILTSDDVRRGLRAERTLGRGAPIATRRPWRDKYEMSSDSRSRASKRQRKFVGADEFVRRKREPCPGCLSPSRCTAVLNDHA